MWNVFQMKTGSNKALNNFRNCIIGCNTDQASTERKLADALALHKTAEVNDVLGRCERGDLCVESADPDLYFYPRALAATDPMHTIWNSFEMAVKGKGTVDEHMWIDYKKQLRGILAFLGHRGRRQRWMSSQQLPPHQANTFASWRFLLVDWKLVIHERYLGLSDILRRALSTARGYCRVKETH